MSETNNDSGNNTLENVEAATTNNDNNNEEEDAGIEVEKKLLSVEVTLPSMFFEDETGEIDYDGIEADLMDEGIEDVTIHDNGSITLKMSKKLHKEMMADLDANLIVSIDDIVSDDNIASIKTIETNKTYTKWDIYVDQALYENSFDGFSIFGLGIAALMYQAFDGQNLEKTKTTFNLIDESTNEKFDEMIYPDDLENQEGE